VDHSGWVEDWFPHLRSEMWGTPFLATVEESGRALRAMPTLAMMKPSRTWGTGLCWGLGERSFATANDSPPWRDFGVEVEGKRLGAPRMGHSVWLRSR